MVFVLYELPRFELPKKEVHKEEQARRKYRRSCDDAAFEYNDMKIIWKIDYYDKEYEYASEDPADITKTNRVLTVMLADEY